MDEKLRTQGEGWHYLLLRQLPTSLLIRQLTILLTLLVLLLGTLQNLVSYLIQTFLSRTERLLLKNGHFIAIFNRFPFIFTKFSVL